MKSEELKQLCIDHVYSVVTSDEKTMLQWIYEYVALDAEKLDEEAMEAYLRCEGVLGDEE